MSGRRQTVWCQQIDNDDDDDGDITTTTASTQEGYIVFTRERQLTLLVTHILMINDIDTYVLK